MQPDTTNKTQNTAYLTLTEKSKAETKPWFSHLLRHLARKRSGSILGHTHTHTHTRSPCCDVQLTSGGWKMSRGGGMLGRNCAGWKGKGKRVFV